MSHSDNLWKAELNRVVENVQIEFLTAGEKAKAFTASVNLGQDVMVISIADQPLSGPYLVRGKKVDHFFAGTDSFPHEVQVNVIARWTLLGDVYVGIWIEEGVEYLFSFRIPRRKGTSPPD